MTVCLLVATYERTPLLRNNLSRIAELTQPDEIVVVDDGGSDGCADLCEEFRASSLPQLRYVYTDNPGHSLCSHARNVGINATDADLIIQTEPEMVFETDIVAQMIDRFDGDNMIAAGTIHKDFEDGGHDTLVGWAATYVVLYRREWLIGVGGWDESFPDPWGWDDVDLLSRVRIRYHANQVIDPEIVARHQWHPITPCPSQKPNADHFFAKRFHPSNGGTEGPDDPDVVIPRAADWGRP
jgi:glycosyltransferase involved in cell wall biosynthesis